MRCSRRELCSRVLTPAFTFKAPGLFVRCCAMLLCPLVHPEVLDPVQSSILSLSVLIWSRALTFGYGCTVYVGVGVGAGDAEVDVIYISFIMVVLNT